MSGFLLKYEISKANEYLQDLIDSVSSFFKYSYCYCLDNKAIVIHMKSLRYDYAYAYAAFFVCSCFSFLKANETNKNHSLLFSSPNSASYLDLHE